MNGKNNDFKLPKSMDPTICKISTFEENPFINLDGHISPILLINLPLRPNNLYEARVLNKEGKNFVTVETKGQTLTIELAKQ